MPDLQAANPEITYGPSLWQLVRNLLGLGYATERGTGSVQMAVPVGALPELAKHFDK